MEGNLIIAGILYACLLLAVMGAASLLKRRFGKRQFGIGGVIAMIPISWVLMLMASHVVSTDSYYWYVAIGACTGVSVLVSQFLFCEPPSG